MSYVCMVLLLAFMPSASWAITSAGTVINNTATIQYNIGGLSQPEFTSATSSFKVDQIIDLNLTLQTSTVSVNSPDINKAIAFTLTNTGNGPSTYQLARNNAISGDNFDPINGSVGLIYIENGLSPGFQASGANADTLYVLGSNDITLAAGSSVTIYVVSNIPSGLSNGNKGTVQLNAWSTLVGPSGANPGTNFTGQGVSNTTAMVGLSRAEQTAQGQYLVSGLVVNLVKSIAKIVDPSGGSTVIPGSILHYSISVSISGIGTATDLVITDPMPTNVTYVSNSLILEGVAKTDAIDSDNGQFSNNEILVSLGNVVAPKTYLIQFSATVN